MQQYPPHECDPASLHDNYPAQPLSFKTLQIYAPQRGYQTKVFVPPHVPNWILPELTGYICKKLPILQKAVSVCLYNNFPAVFSHTAPFCIQYRYIKSGATLIQINLPPTLDTRRSSCPHQQKLTDLSTHMLKM